MPVISDAELDLRRKLAHVHHVAMTGVAAQFVRHDARSSRLHVDYRRLSLQPPAQRARAVLMLAELLDIEITVPSVAEAGPGGFTPPDPPGPTIDGEAA